LEVLLGTREAREHELHDLAVALHRRRGLRRSLEHACNAHDIDDVERERALTDGLDALVDAKWDKWEVEEARQRAGRLPA